MLPGWSSVLWVGNLVYLWQLCENGLPVTKGFPAWVGGWIAGTYELDPLQWNPLLVGGAMEAIVLHELSHEGYNTLRPYNQTSNQHVKQYFKQYVKRSQDKHEYAHGNIVMPVSDTI